MWHVHNIWKSDFHILSMFFIFFLRKRNSITIKSMNLNLGMWKCIIYELGNRGIIFPLTLVVHVLLIVISPCNVLWMRITNEQKSATMVTINLKVSMCRDIIANSNTTKSYVFNPYDSCNTDVNTLLNAIHVHVYSDYVISFWMYMYVHSTL